MEKNLTWPTRVRPRKQKMSCSTAAMFSAPVRKYGAVFRGRPTHPSPVPSREGNPLLRSPPPRFPSCFTKVDRGLRTRLGPAPLHAPCPNAAFPLSRALSRAFSASP